MFSSRKLNKVLFTLRGRQQTHALITHSIVKDKTLRTPKKISLFHNGLKSCEFRFLKLVNDIFVFPSSIFFARDFRVIIYKDTSLIYFV